MKRTILASAVFFAMAAPVAVSQTNLRATDNLYQCATLTDDAERLACYDARVAELRSAEETGVIRTVDTAEIEKIEREAFGFALPNLRLALRGFGNDEEGKSERAERVAETKEISEVVLPVSRITKHSVTGRLTITLEDGQVWEQVDSRSLPAGKIRNPKEARIRRAALRSFMMSIDDSVAIRVKRVS